jgi:aryl-alcohol dehydrogenase-like predicted oxidoreductase
VRFPVSDPGGEGLTPDRVRRACDASLRRLDVDEIDLYLLNAPDPSVPARGHAGRAGRAGARGQGAGARLLELPRLPACSLVERSIELELLPTTRFAGGAGLGAGGITAPIIGPRTLEQLEGLLGATELTLNADERTRLEAHAPPPDVYPQRMLREQAGIGDPAVLTRPRAQ